MVEKHSRYYYITLKNHKDKECVHTFFNTLEDKLNKNETILYEQLDWAEDNADNHKRSGEDITVRKFRITVEVI